MNTNSNKYTIIYAIILVVIVAALLSVFAIYLQPKQAKNIELEKKRNILAAINISTENDNDVDKLFNEHIVKSITVDDKGNINEDIEAFNIDVKTEFGKVPDKRFLPIYIAATNDGTKYLFALYGKGLWGPLWGYIALNDDFNTVYGVYFDHKGETPGLGAEISTFEFQHRFIDKKIYNKDNNFVSIDVVKNTANNNPNAVDGITGGTITSKGLKNMLEISLKNYINYITNNKNKQDE